MTYSQFLIINPEGKIININTKSREAGMKVERVAGEQELRQILVSLQSDITMYGIDNK